MLTMTYLILLTMTYLILLTMTYLIFTMFFLLSPELVAAESCLISKELQQIYNFTRENQQHCETAIKDSVRRDVNRKCKELGYKIDKKKNSPKFTEFSYTFDVSDKEYFCKNRNGYKSRVATIVEILTKNLQSNNREYHKKISSQKAYAPNSKPSSPPKKDEVKKWKCKSNGYGRIIVVVNETEKKQMENFYTGTVCRPLLKK